MNSVASLMREYFDPGIRRAMISEGLPKDVPIKAKKVEWKVTQDGAALMRTYEFDNAAHLRSFVDQLLGMQERIEHHAQILVEAKTVKVRVSTHSLNRITELDTEYAAEADHIFKETGTSNE